MIIKNEKSLEESFENEKWIIENRLDDLLKRL